jgi:hypothetical protein
MHDSWFRGFTITLFTFGITDMQKSFDLLMVGVPWKTRSLLAVQFTRDEPTEIDFLFFRFTLKEKQ